MECGRCLLEWCCWDGVMHVRLDNCRRVSPWLSLGSICSVRYGMKYFITKSQRVKAWIPSMRKTASKAMNSASVELCETEVCFSYIQLVRTNLWIPKKHRIPPDVDSEVSRKVRVLKQSQPTLLCCISHLTTLFEFTGVTNVRNQNVLNFCHKLSSTTWWYGQACSLTIQYQICQFEPNKSISQQFERILLTILQQILFLLPWIGCHPWALRLWMQDDRDYLLNVPEFALKYKKCLEELGFKQHWNLFFGPPPFADKLSNRYLAIAKYHGSMPWILP